jgi:hypothetical protein
MRLTDNLEMGHKLRYLGMMLKIETAFLLPLSLKLFVPSSGI